MNEEELVNIGGQSSDLQDFHRTQYFKPQNFDSSHKNEGNYLNDLCIEGVDSEGRMTLRSLRDSNASNGLKWKRKSELSQSFASSGKSRISIKGANQYEFNLRADDPFNH